MKQINGSIISSFKYMLQTDKIHAETSHSKNSQIKHKFTRLRRVYHEDIFDQAYINNIIISVVYATKNDMLYNKKSTYIMRWKKYETD